MGTKDAMEDKHELLAGATWGIAALSGLDSAESLLGEVRWGASPGLAQLGVLGASAPATGAPRADSQRSRLSQSLSYPVAAGGRAGATRCLQHCAEGSQPYYVRGEEGCALGATHLSVVGRRKRRRFKFDFDPRGPMAQEAEANCAIGLRKIGSGLWEGRGYY